MQQTTWPAWQLHLQSLYDNHSSSTRSYLASIHNQQPSQMIRSLFEQKQRKLMKSKLLYSKLLKRLPMMKGMVLKPPFLGLDDCWIMFSFSEDSIFTSATISLTSSTYLWREEKYNVFWVFPLNSDFGEQQLHGSDILTRKVIPSGHLWRLSHQVAAF